MFDGVATGADEVGAPTPGDEIPDHGTDGSFEVATTIAGPAAGLRKRVG